MIAFLKRRWILLSCVLIPSMTVAIAIAAFHFGRRHQQAIDKDTLERGRMYPVLKLELEELRKHAGAILTENEALAIAADFARKEGVDFTHYQEPHISYNTRDNGMWRVFYLGKADERGMIAIGHHFHISVEDKTKQCRFWPGM